MSVLKEAIKVCILHNQITPYRIPLFNALAKNVNLHVFFCCSRANDRFWDAKIGECNFELTMLKGLELKLSGREIYIKPSAILQAFRYAPDVMVLMVNYETSPTMFILYLLCQFKKLPYVVWIADTNYRYFTPKRPWEKIADRMHFSFKKMLVKGARAVVAYGQLTKKHVVEKLNKKNHLVYVGTQVWPCIDMSGLKKNFETDPFIFLYIGYLNERKRIQDLIQAFSKLLDPSVRLTIAGDGPQYTEVLCLAENDQRIKMTGYVEGKAKAELFRQSHAFVMPSVFDNMPNSIIEAMAYGLPIIASRECHCPEWLRDNALTFSAGDVDSMFQHMAFLVSNRPVARHMSASSVAISRQFDIAFGVNAFTSAIKTALK